MLDGAAHLSTTSEGELRILAIRILKDSIGLSIPEPALVITLLSGKLVQARAELV